MSTRPKPVSKSRFVIKEVIPTPEQKQARERRKLGSQTLLDLETYYEWLLSGGKEPTARPEASTGQYL